MHELSIVQSILETAEAEAWRHRATKVTRIHCRIGCLRQVDGSLLQEAFHVARADTCASEAELVITGVGMHLSCGDCAHETMLDGWGFECPRCGSTKVHLEGGDSIELTSLEMEVPDEDRGIEAEHFRQQRRSRREEPRAARSP